MKYETAGDPITGLKWTRKATRKIALELKREGIMVSDKCVGRILEDLVVRVLPVSLRSGKIGDRVRTNRHWEGSRGCGGSQPL